MKVHQLAPGWGEQRRASYVRHAVRSLVLAFGRFLAGGRVRQPAPGLPRGTPRLVSAPCRASSCPGHHSVCRRLLKIVVNCLQCLLM